MEQIEQLKGPKGDTGDVGPQGPQGPIGPQGSPFLFSKTYFSIEEMNEDLENIEEGDYVLISSGDEHNGEVYQKIGTSLEIIVNLSGPQGIQGEIGPQGSTGLQGPQGEEGPQGPVGLGVPAGGSEGQVLTKVSENDYDTAWRDSSGGGASEEIEEMINAAILARHPIGSIEINVSGANPSTYIGGEWELWGSGRMPVGVDTTQTEFNEVEKTGGSKNLQSHTHSVNITSGNQSADHTHSVGAHSHGLNNHTHSFGATTGGMSANSTGRAGQLYLGTASTASEGALTRENSATLRSYSVSSNSGNSWGYLNLNVAHTHYVSGTTGGNSGSTANSSAFNTGGQSTNHTHLVSGNTGSAGSGDAQNLSPYITCYMWKRTA